MSREMSRGEMIRRLDEASKEVHDRLANGPLTPDEQHTLAASLSRLLPIVADSLQNEEDRVAAEALAAATSPPVADSTKPK
jgi:hypothetical protein